MKRLFFDIETSPNIVLSWRTGYKLNVSPESIIQERKIICIAWKWEGEEETHSLSWDKDQDDKKMIEKFLPIANEADEIVAYFGDSFDMPWFRTRCVFHELTFPDYKMIDPLQWVRRKFYFNSNKLDYVAQYLGLGQKMETNFDLWKNIVLNKDKEALKYMMEYNEHDVVILEKVWERLQLLVKPKTHLGVEENGTRWSCPRCASENVKTSKKRITAAGTLQWQMQCKDDGGYYSITNSQHEKYEEEKLV